MQCIGCTALKSLRGRGYWQEYILFYKTKGGSPGASGIGATRYGKK